MSKAGDVEQAAAMDVAVTVTNVDTDVKAVAAQAPLAEIAPATTQTSAPIVTVTATTVNGENNGKAAASTATSEPSTTTTTTEQVQASTATEPTNKGKSQMDPLMINFKVLYVLVQLFGITMIVLVGAWVGQHWGGFGGPSNPKLEFNWHPLLMTIGFIFLYGNSILIYRGFRTVRKKTLKLTHAGIHMGAFVLTVIALKTAFDSHNLVSPPIPNMYSLHSWLGLSAVILFCLQYVAGFMAYLVPNSRDQLKMALMPLHIYFGLFGFVLAIASGLMGITEKNFFAGDYAKLPPAAVLSNVIGVMFVIFGGLVVYLATEPSYKRKPLPEDTALLASNE